MVIRFEGANFHTKVWVNGKLAGQNDDGCLPFEFPVHDLINFGAENLIVGVDFFAPESVLTPDGRRVMWAWLATVDHNDGDMYGCAARVNRNALLDAIRRSGLRNPNPGADAQFQLSQEE